VPEKYRDGFSALDKVDLEDLKAHLEVLKSNMEDMSTECCVCLAGTSLFLDLPECSPTSFFLVC
jgi:hypothetical protein